MARSKFIWLVIYETGETQFIKAQTIWQILNCSELVEDSDWCQDGSKQFIIPVKCGVYNLRGFSAWLLGGEDPDIWSVLFE